MSKYVVTLIWDEHRAYVECEAATQSEAYRKAIESAGREAGNRPDPKRPDCYRIDADCSLTIGADGSPGIAHPGSHRFTEGYRSAR